MRYKKLLKKLALFSIIFVGFAYLLYLLNYYNPNGSINDIAGIFNENRNVLGMMPHPERAAESILGSSDGLALFESMIENM